MDSLDVTYDIGYRKANGIYYTPDVIVDYMVRETVSRLVEGKCPDEISEISIVDPACGDGNFLVGAYKYLVNIIGIGIMNIRMWINIGWIGI